MSNTPTTTYKCSKCDTVFSTRSQRDEHNRQIHQERVTVIYHAATHENTTISIQRSVEDDHFHCHFCDMAFKTSRGILAHARDCPTTSNTTSIVPIPSPIIISEDSKASIRQEMKNLFQYTEENGNANNQQGEFPKNARNLDQWLVRLRWHELVQKFSNNNSKLLIDLCAVPKSQGDDPLYSIYSLAHRYLSDTRKMAQSRLDLTLRRHLNSVDETIYDSTSKMIKKSWHPLDQESSVERYSMLFTRLICMLLRIVVVREEALYESLVLHADLRVLLNRLWQNIGNGGDDMTMLMDIFHQICLSLVCQKSPLTQDFTMTTDPILRFLVFASLDKNGTFIPPKHITGIIAKLKFWARAIIYTEICSKRDDTTIPHDLLFYLKEGKLTPFNSICEIMHIITTVVRETNPSSSITWVPSTNHKEMYIRGKKVTISLLSRMAQDEIGMARNMLYTDLLRGFVPPPSPHKEIEDEIDSIMLGYSFLTDQRNNLYYGSTRLLDHFFTTRSNHFFTTTNTNNALWNVDACNKWMEKCYEFRKHLFFAIHLTAGMPARGSEISTIKIFNAKGQMRSIYWSSLGTIMIIISYSKTRKRDRAIVRFLPKPLSELLLNYLVHVRPMEIFFARNNQRARKCLAEYLFTCISGEQVLDGKMICNIFRQIFLKRAGFPMSFASYRHIAQGFGDKLLVKSKILRQIMHTDQEVLDQQIGHAIATASRHYARSGNEDHPMVDKDKRLEYYILSVSWQELLGLHNSDDKRTSLLNNNNNNNNDSSIKDLMMIKKRRTEHHHHHHHTTTNTIIMNNNETQQQQVGSSRIETGGEGGLSPSIYQKILVKLNQINMSGFKSMHQAASIGIACERKNHLLAVLPTGGGKTLVFLLPALMDAGMVTIVISPLVVLKKDYKQRAEKIGLSCEIWDMTTENKERMRAVQNGSLNVNIIVIAAESVPKSMEFLSQLHSMNRLARIVFDECHLIVTWGLSFRPALIELRRLQSIGVQLVFLTATLTMKMQKELLENIFYINSNSISIIRCLTTRPEIEYSVIDSNAIEDDIIKTIIHHHHDDDDDSNQSRVIVYCATVQELESLSSAFDRYNNTTNAIMLKYYHYYAEAKNKNDQFKSWEESHDQKRATIVVMIATKAFSVGVDYPHVRLVIHYGLPSSVIDYAQESGRAGRDGKYAKSIIISNDNWYIKREQMLMLMSKEEKESLSIMKSKYSNGTCKRSIIQKELDNNDTCCLMLTGCALCDTCRRCSSSISSSNNNMKMLVALSSQNTIQNENHNEAAMILPSSIQARNRELHGLSIAYQLLELLANLDKCVLCSLHGTTTSCQQQQHTLQHCPIMKGRCLRCLNRDHNQKTCPIVIRYKSGACFYCGLPSKTAAGTGGGQATFHSDDSFGTLRCKSLARDRLLPVSWYAYRTEHYKRQLFSKFPSSMTTTTTTTIHQVKEQEYATWLVQQDEMKLPMAAYVFVWMLSNK